MSENNSSESSSSKSSNLLRSSLTVSSFTFLSRVLGLIRDVVIANYFGSSAAADAFFVAFRIPNFFRRLFGEGAFSQAFVPVLAGYRVKQSDQVKILVNYVAGTLGAILSVISALGVLAAPLIIWLFAPGFHQYEDKLTLAGDMLRITFPYLLLICLTAFSGSILNSYNYFSVPAFTPVLLNISMIGAAIFLRPYLEVPAMALAWGVLFAGVAQLLIQLPFLWRLGLLPKPQWGLSHPGVRRIFKLMLPALFSVSIAQISLLLDTVLASFLKSGSISWLYYSDRLSELPLGIFGIAIGTVILPNLSRAHANNSEQDFSKIIDWGIRLVLLVGLPASIALFVLSGPLMATLFAYGKMTNYDVHMASMSLQAYAFGLLFFMLIKILAPGYFARQDMRTPVRIGVQSLGANMILNLILIWPLAHVGLALATALSSLLNTLLLGYGLYRTNIYRPNLGWGSYLTKLIISNVIMASVLLALSHDLSQWLQWGVIARIEQMAILVATGLTAYIACLLMLGIRPKQFYLRQ